MQRVHLMNRVSFFFSSRRRHTRCGRDWSSDVCSSDLHVGAIRHPDMPFSVDNLLGKAEFDGARLKIESLDFLAGGGPVTGTGEIRLGDLRRSESPFTISAAEVRFRGRSVKGEFPEGFRPGSAMDLAVRP